MDLFRISTLLCLLGAILLTTAALRTFDLEAADRDKTLAFLLLTCLLPFALFYVGHLVVQHRIGHELDPQLGYVQALGSLGIMSAAAMSIFLPTLTATFQPLSGWLQTYAWFFVLAFGEGVFVANVTRSSSVRAPAKQRVAAGASSVIAPRTQPLTARAQTRTWGWPRSASATFAIAAVVLALAGWLFSSVNPGAALPATSGGRFSWMPASYLWLLAALPFAIFVVPYGVLEWKMRWSFAETTTRLHFICTLLVVLDLVRLYKDWAMSVASRFEPKVTAPDFLSTAAFVALSLGTFAWNIRNASRAS